MDPITIGLLAAANLAVSATSNSAKKKAQDAQINLEVEQAKLDAEQKAYDVSQAFREATSYNLALNAMGFGGTTGFRQSLATGEAALNRDLGKLAKQQRFTHISGESAKAAASADKFTGNASAGISSLLMANELGLFKGNKKGSLLGGKK